VNLNLYLCGTTSICGGAVNLHTGPDGKLHLPAQAASPRYSGIAYDGAAGNVKRKDPQLKPRCARFSFRVLLLMPRALCTVCQCLWQEFTKCRDQHDLWLRVMNTYPQDLPAE
jgi:hypothetical protein